MQPAWEALFASGADVIVNGHAHFYERFAPMEPDRDLNHEGAIREFVVGDRGASHYPLDDIQPNSEVRNTDTYGVLKLTLHPISYEWEFVPVAGETFTDSGTAGCH
jgi:acid phosphatase type 7